MSATESNEWLTRKDAANYLATLGYAISADHLRNLAANNNRKNGPPYYRIRRQTIRYKREDLQKWLKSKTTRVE